MKISFIIPGPIESCSGGFLYNRMLISCLTGMGDKVTVHALPDIRDDECLKNLEESIKASGSEIVLEDGLAHDFLCRLNKRLTGAMRTRNVALIHNPCTFIEPDPARIKEISRSEREFLMTVHGIVCNSETTRRDLARITGINLPSVIANPGKDHIDVRSTANPDRANRISILAVGNLSFVKGYTVMLRELSLLDSERWTLLIAGRKTDQSYARLVENMAGDLGISCRVKFLEHIDNHQIGNFLAASDIYLSTSHYEGWGIAAVEAMAHSLPVVVSQKGAPSEYIRNGLEGFLVDPEIPGDTARRLDMLIADQDLRRSMGAQALARYRTLPNWGESMEKLRSFIIQIKN